MRLETGYENKRSRIEILPLIDVVFLLLVFFIYAMLSMTVCRGLRVQLPAGHGSVEDSQSLIIKIMDDNSLWLGEKPVSVSDAIAEAIARGCGTDKPVLISGDRRANIGIAVELLAAFRNADIDAVSFQVHDDSSEL